MPAKKTKVEEIPELKITLVRSTIGRRKDQAATVRALGFTKLHQTRTLPDNPAVRGMVAKVQHLVVVEESN